MEATLPPAREVNGALARLGDIRKENELLRGQIEKLYAGTCSNCGAGVIADYFIHRRDETRTQLTEKVYVCAKCGARRDDATNEDRQRAEEINPRSLPYHLLFRRLTADNTGHSATVRRLLQFYTPRNLYALALLTQKLDVEFREGAQRTVLDALMLHALDMGTSLYPAPDALPERDIPPQFVESKYLARSRGCRARFGRPRPRRAAHRACGRRAARHRTLGIHWAWRGAGVVGHAPRGAGGFSACQPGAA